MQNELLTVTKWIHNCCLCALYIYCTFSDKMPLPAKKAFLAEDFKLGKTS